MNRRIVEEFSTEGEFENGKPRPALPRELIIPMFDSPDRWIITQRYLLRFKTPETSTTDPALCIARGWSSEKDGYDSMEKTILSTDPFTDQAVLDDLRAFIIRSDYQDDRLIRRSEGIAITAQIHSATRNPGLYIMGSQRGSNLIVQAQGGIRVEGRERVGVEWQILISQHDPLLIDDYLRLAVSTPPNNQGDRFYVMSASIEVLSCDWLKVDPRTGRVVDPTVDGGRVGLVDAEKYETRTSQRVEYKRQTLL